MNSDGAQLSSSLTGLEDLTKQITEIADRYSGTPDEDVAADLYEVERALRSATRRLTRVVHRLS